MTKLDEILRPEAVRRAAGVPDLTEHHLVILRGDLDANCRAFAVALGIWDEPWPTGESAPRLVCGACGWGLYLISRGELDDVYDFIFPEDAPDDVPVGTTGDAYMVIDLEEFTQQAQALDVCHAIWAVLGEKE
jgi:hypothetical protein